MQIYGYTYVFSKINIKYSPKLSKELLTLITLILYLPDKYKNRKLLIYHINLNYN